MQQNKLKHINTYASGMNQDLSPRLFDNKHYFEADWLSPVNNETGTIGPMNNLKGTIDKLTFTPYPTWDNPTKHTIIGTGVLRDKLIIVTNKSNLTYIYEFIDDGTETAQVSDSSGLGNVTTGNFRLLWTDDYDINPTIDVAYKRLGYTANTKLDIVTKYENDDIQKIYLADGTKPLRYFNTIYNANTNDYTQFTESDFNIVPNVILNKPAFSSYTTGNLLAGVNYYSYQLYRVNGVETAFSQTSDPIVISTTVNKSDTIDLKGSDLETNSGIGIVLSLTSLDTTYDRIRCVAIEYTEYDAVPTVRIFYEGNVGSSLSITDTGVSIGTYDLAEFRVLNQYYIIPKVLTSKNNMLFAANISEKYFDLDEYLIDSEQTSIMTTDAGGTGKQFWDSRSYRFNQDTTKRSYLYRADYGDTITLLQTSPDYDSVPYNWDCTNRYNDTTWNYYYYNNTTLANKYTVDGLLGSSGKNVRITFSNPTAHQLDVGTEYQTFQTPISEQILGRKKTYQEDEIYRLSIQFRDNKGRESFPKWVIDMRMPDFIDESDVFCYVSGSATYTKNLYPYFSVDNIPVNDDGTNMDWRILRVKREGKDKTVLGTAIVSSTLDGSLTSTGTGNHSTNLYGAGKIMNANEYLTGTYLRYDDTTDTGVNTTYLQLYTPEAFFSDLNLDGCYLNHQGYLQNTIGYKGTGKYRDNSVTSWTALTVSSHNTYTFQALKKYNAFIPAITPTYYTIGSSSSRLININKWKRVKAQPLENYDEDLSYHIIGSKVYRNINFLDNTKSSQGENGTSFIVEVGARNNTAKFGYLTNASDYARVLYTLIKKDGYPYGGSSFESRFNNIYVPASDYTKGATIYGYYGDCVTGYFDYLRTMYDINGDVAEGDEYQEILYFPVKSQTNLNLRLDEGFNRIANVEFSVNKKLTEEGLADIEAGVEIAALYRYNTVYSVDNTTREYIAIPFDSSTNYTYDTRIRRSEVKSNGEYSDSWLKFLANNYIDVDGQYGEITRLDVFKDKLLFWQPKALGTVPVGEKELIPSSNSSTLALGSSGILNRYDYIDDSAGASQKDAVLITPSSILFFSSYRNTMFKYNGQNQPISDILGMNSWFDQYVDITTAIISGYNPLLWEAWFTFGDYTLVFNELTNAFVYFVPGIIPYKYVTFNNNFYSWKGGISPSSTGYKHNLGIYGKVHNTYLTSSITLLVNPRGTTMTIFDIIEMLTEKYASDGTTELQETFDTIRIYNDYQDTGTITLIPDSNIIRRLRTWRFNTIRDNSITSGDPKIRSSFVKIKLTFANSSANEKILLHNLTTNYRLSKMMG